MKPVYILSVFLIFIIGSSTCSFSQINLKKIPSIKANRLLQLDTDTDTATGMSEGNNTEYYDPDKKSSGLSAGAIAGIVIGGAVLLIAIITQFFSNYLILF
jgi:putative N-acetylmannosamine-6-phosphate epimerase